MEGIVGPKQASIPGDTCSPRAQAVLFITGDVFELTFTIGSVLMAKYTTDARSPQERRTGKI